MDHMNYRFILAGLFSLCAQATLTASSLYNFGTITGNNAGNGISLDSEPTAYQTNSTVPWYEDNSGSGVTSEQIDCVVAFATTANSCGSPGPGSSASIAVYAPGGTLPPGVSNYLMMDGDPEWGAPVSIDLTGLTAGASYTLSFYEASSEETTATPHTAYDDSFQVYILPGASSGTYLCPQAYCSAATTETTIDSSDLAFTSAVMDNPGGAATNWSTAQSFSFTVPSGMTNVVVEFVTNVASSTGAALPSNVTFMPPMLDLAGVTLTPNTSTPEPGTWGLTMLGAGLIFVSGKLRRRISDRG